MAPKALAWVVVVAAAVALAVSVVLQHRSSAHPGHDRLCAELDARIQEALGDAPTATQVYVATDPARQANNAGCYGAQP
jgi:hypothetical protein